MRNLLSFLQSFAVRPTSVAVVAPRHGSYTLGLLSLHMAWKRLISNLNVVFQGAKKAATAKKKKTPKKRWKTARRARSIFILIPEADNTVNKHRVLFSSKFSLTARWGGGRRGTGIESSCIHLLSVRLLVTSFACVAELSLKYTFSCPRPC